MQQRTSFLLKYTLAMLLGFPFFGSGLLLCFTVIGIPVGLILMVLGALPAYFVQKGRMRQLQEERVKHVKPQEIPPWEKASTGNGQVIEYAVDEWGNPL